MRGVNLIALRRDAMDELIAHAEAERNVPFPPELKDLIVHVIATIRAYVFRLCHEANVSVEQVYTALRADMGATEREYPQIFQWMCRTPLFLIDGIPAFESFLDYLEDQGIRTTGESLSGEIADFQDLAEWLDDHEIDPDGFVGFFNTLAVIYLESWDLVRLHPKSIADFRAKGNFYPEVTSMQSFMDTLGIGAFTNLVCRFAPVVAMGGTERGVAQLYLKTQIPSGLDIRMTAFAHMREAEIEGLTMVWDRDIPGFSEAHMDRTLMEEE